MVIVKFSAIAESEIKFGIAAVGNLAGANQFSLQSKFRSAKPNLAEKEADAVASASFSGVGDGIRLHFRRWRKQRIASVKPSAAMLVRIAFNLSNPAPPKPQKCPSAFAEGHFCGVGDGIRTHEYRNHNPVP